MKADEKTKYYLFEPKREFRLWYTKGKNSPRINIPGHTPEDLHAKKVYLYVHTETVLLGEPGAADGPLMSIRGYASEIIYNPTEGYISIY